MPVARRTVLIPLDDLTLAIGALHLLIERLESDVPPGLEGLAIRVVDRLATAIDAAYA